MHNITQLHITFAKHEPINANTKNNADKMELNINLLRPGAQNNTNSITFPHFYCSLPTAVTHRQTP